MAVTFRSSKGAPLTHDELDQNFREYFYSSSFIGPISSPQGVNIYRLSATNATSSIYFPTAVGNNYSIQIKSGASNISSSFLTGSDNFKYDFDNDHFSVSGSAEISGSLTVLGKITAREIVTIITSSQIFVSGSTKFGDSFEDTHLFEGLMNVSNGITGSLTGSVEGVGVRNFSQSISLRTTALENFSSSLDNTYATDVQVGLATASLSSSLATDIASNLGSINTLTGNINTLNNKTLISSSVLSSPSQGTVRIVNNGVTSNVDTGLQTSDSPTFAGLTVTGTVTAQTYNTQLVSSSIIYSSGSTKFGDSVDDVHRFTGSLNLLGPAYIGGILNIPGFPNVSASLAAAVSASGTSNVNIANNSNNRVLTATGTDTLNGEANLTFDGSTLGVTGAITATGAGSLNSLTVTGDATINSTKITKFTASDTDITGLIGGTTTGTLIQGLAAGHFVLGMQEDSLTDSFAIIGGNGDFYSNTTYDKLIFKVSGSGQTYIGGALSVDGALDVDGTISATNDIIAYASSDERLKDNITPIQGALGKINQIGGYEFDWNSNSEHSGHDVGVIAQEIEKVLPEIVVNRDNGYKAVRYEKIVALLIQAVKEQQLQIDELKSKL